MALDPRLRAELDVAIDEFRARLTKAARSSRNDAVVDTALRAAIDAVHLLVELLPPRNLRHLRPHAADPDNRPTVMRPARARGDVAS